MMIMFSPFQVSTKTALRSLEAVVFHGGFVKDGAHHANDNCLSELVFGLQCIVNNQAEAAVQKKEQWLKRQTAQITSTLFHESPDGAGGYRCTAFFGNKKFLFSQTSLSLDIEITDLDNDEKELLEGITFSMLQKQLLQQYIAEESVDLSNFDLTHVDVGAINFNGAIISCANVDAIIGCNGNLNGAKLKDSDIVFDEHGISPSVAVELIRFGMAKEWVLEKFLIFERKQGKTRIELSSFDLAGMNLTSFDFSNTVLSRNNLDAILAGGGNIRYATLASGEDVSALNLVNVSLGEAMADSLIRNGAEVKSVLNAFFLSKPTALSYRINADWLNRYIEDERRRAPMSTMPIEASIDLGEFNFENIDVKKVNFKDTTLSQDNVEAIIAHGGSLNGTKLKGTDIVFDDTGISKVVAYQLIDAGINARWVLMHFLASERNLKRANINIDGFDLTGMHLQYMDLRDVDQSGLSFNKADNYEKRAQAHFEQDLLTMLKAYSQTVASILLISASKNVVRPVPGKSLHNHDHLINDYVRNQTNNVGNLEAAIKSSMGNCGEMAMLCKSMMDIYLQKSLELLGYHGFSIKAVYAAAKQPSDHEVVYLSCKFYQFKANYIIDPWSDGGAWLYNDAIQYYTAGKQSCYVSSTIESPIAFQKIGGNAALEKPEFQLSASDVFERFKIKAQLDAVVKESAFLGVPLQ